jgi:hypothetical protein
VVACGRNIGTSGATYSIVNGVVTSTFISTGNNGGNGNCQLAINNNLASAFSDWQLSRLYVWDTHLSEEVFAQASAKLNSYLSNSGETSICLVCPAAYYSSTGSTACTSCPANSCRPSEVPHRRTAPATLVTLDQQAARVTLAPTDSTKTHSEIHNVRITQRGWSARVKVAHTLPRTDLPMVYVCRWRVQERAAISVSHPGMYTCPHDL